MLIMDGKASTIAQAYKVDRERKEQYRTVYHISCTLTKSEKNYGKIEG